VSEVTSGDRGDPSGHGGWPARILGLTGREAQVLAQIADGRSNAEIAALLHLSENTVKSYVRQLYRTIRVTSRTQAVLWASRNGFVPGCGGTEYPREDPDGPTPR